MQILANAARDVEINAPLKIKSSLTTITNNVIVGVATSLTETALTVMAGGRIEGDLTVVGSLTVNGLVSFANPNWVAVIINFSGGNPIFVRNAGRFAATSLVRVSGQAAGVVQFDFPTHPAGVNYVISSTGNAGFTTISGLVVRTSTRVAFAIRNSTTMLNADGELHVLISAY
jgi:hypothetical protein